MRLQFIPSHALQLIGALATICLLGGCKNDHGLAAPVTPAATNTVSAVASAKINPLAKYAELMRVAFGKQYREASGDAVAELPMLDDRSVTDWHLLAPVNMTILPSGEAVLVLNGETSDEAGNAFSSHAQGGKLSVYIFGKNGTQWTVIRRHENIAELGSSGSIGSTKWVQLADGKPGLAVEHGGVWQGYFTSLLALFDLTAPEMNDLVDPMIRIVSDSTGACTDALGKCWEVKGNYHFVKGKEGAVYDDLQIDFNGEEAVTRTDTKARDKHGDILRTRTPVSGVARYAYDGTSYKLASGENLAPDF